MADIQGPLGSMQEELEGMVECPVHFGVLIRPKSLPCGHVICLDCIRRWVEARRGILVCPECNQEQILPQEGVQGLPNCYRLIRLCEYLGSLNIADAIEGGAQGDVAPMVMQCDSHQDLSLDRICRDCRQPVCQQCVREQHVGHMCLDGTTFMRHMDRPLKKLQDEARAKQREAARYQMEITKQMEQLETNRVHANATIDQYVGKLVEKVTSAGNQLKYQVEAMYHEKKQVIENQLSTLQGQYDEVENAIQLANDQPDDLQQNLASLPPMVDNASKLLKEVQKMNIQSAPKTSNDIWVEMDGTILEWFDPRGNKKIGQACTSAIPCPSECVLKVTSEMPILLSREVEVQLILNDGHGAEVKVQDANFISAVVITANGKHVKQVFELKGGKFYTNFRPQCVGKYQFITKLYNQKVKNSPLKILVKPRGTLTIDLKGHPPFVAPHDVQKIGENYLVLDDEKIMMVDKEGRMVNKFMIKKDQVFHPYAVAYHEQAYYVTALKGKMVVKFSKTGLPVLEIGKGMGVFEAPTGIAIGKNGAIYVADDKKGCIFVFSAEGKLLHQLSSPGRDKHQLSHPWYIKFNRQGQLVVADCGNCRIQVFNITTGKSVRSIYVEHQGKPMACRGLDVDINDNIYVTARMPGKSTQYECVMVYTLDGDFLGSFAESPPKKGLHFARGIRVTGGPMKTTALVVDGGSSAVKFYVI